MAAGAGGSRATHHGPGSGTGGRAVCTAPAAGMAAPMAAPSFPCTSRAAVIIIVVVFASGRRRQRVDDQEAATGDDER